MKGLSPAPPELSLLGLMSCALVGKTLVSFAALSPGGQNRVWGYPTPAFLGHGPGTSRLAGLCA